MIFSENRIPLFRIMLLKRAAASIAPDGAVGADARARYHHDWTLDHDPGSYHDDAVGTASSVGTAMVAGAASARGVRRAKTCERDGKQNCREKGLHVSSIV